MAVTIPRYQRQVAITGASSAVQASPAGFDQQSQAMRQVAQGFGVAADQLQGAHLRAMRREDAVSRSFGLNEASRALEEDMLSRRDADGLKTMADVHAYGEYLEGEKNRRLQEYKGSADSRAAYEASLNDLNNRMLGAASKTATDAQDAVITSEFTGYMNGLAKDAYSDPTAIEGAFAAVEERLKQLGPAITDARADEFRRIARNQIARSVFDSMIDGGDLDAADEALDTTVGLDQYMQPETYRALKGKIRSIRQAKAESAANQPLERVIGPDGNVILVPRSQAAGMRVPQSGDAPDLVTVDIDGVPTLVPETEAAGMRAWRDPSEGGALVEVENEDGTVTYATRQDAVGKRVPTTDDGEPLKEVVNPNDPSKTMWVRESEAVGMESPKRSPSVVNNVGDDNSMGTVPPGYAVIDDPTTESGKRMVPIEGSPAAAEAAAAAADAEIRTAVGSSNQSFQADVAKRAIGKAFDLMEPDVWGPDAAGPWSSIASMNPASAAAQLRKRLTTLEASISFDSLQAMREASPTGGALGSVSEGELALLKNSMGTIDPTLEKGELAQELALIGERYTTLVYGSDAEIEVAVQQGKMTAAEADAQRDARDEEIEALHDRAAAIAGEAEESKRAAAVEEEAKAAAAVPQGVPDEDFAKMEEAIRANPNAELDPEMVANLTDDQIKQLLDGSADADPITAEIDQFAESHPRFNELLPAMTDLLESGEAETMEEAYKLAERQADGN